MKWMGRRQSANVEDRRGMGGVAVAGGGIGTVVLVLVAMLFGVDPRVVLENTPSEPPPAQRQGATQHDEQSDFVRVVLADTEEVWTVVFQTQLGRDYREPTLVLFSGSTRSGCGLASAAIGPFYCPEDRKVYLDLGFFRELQQRFQAPGDFAQAYVIAHEVGHHVQGELGILDRAHRAQQGVEDSQANQVQVRVELQADYLAGVWAHHSQSRFHSLEPGDLEEAMGAASAIGDDRLQQEAQGYVVPDSFTHGTSEQRVRWFRKGFESGDVRQGDTFNVSAL